MSASPFLTCRRVATAEDLETMRIIRNRCRAYMTRNRNRISPEQQLRWWRGLDHERTQAFLFDHGGVAVGYGLIKLELSSIFPETIAWLTGALLPAYRGKGLGTRLFRHLIDFSPAWPWLEVRRSNDRARTLYEKLRFRPVAETEDVITMALVDKDRYLLKRDSGDGELPERCPV